MTFDSPAWAIWCAQRATAGVRRLGIALRAGLHTGECERDDRGVTGIAVHVAARLAAIAGPGEILVSRTVTDLVAGSGLAFANRGLHTLRGVPGEREVFAADDPV